MVESSMSQSVNHIAVVDYGMGNLHSVAKALEHVCKNAKVSITADATVVESADRVVFPGVGAIGDCMSEIQRLKINEVINNAIITKPVLGICVGMQALLQHSEENDGVNCLGFMEGQVKYFGDDLLDENNRRLKVPHMGWNEVTQTQAHPLWKGVPDKSRFYFVHSYYVQTNDVEKITGTTNYGTEVVATLADDNIFATQFHPEKSQTVGLTLLRNFLQWDGQR